MPLRGIHRARPQGGERLRGGEGALGTRLPRPGAGESDAGAAICRRSSRTCRAWVSAAYYAAHIHHLRGEPALHPGTARPSPSGSREEQGLELWAAVGPNPPGLGSGECSVHAAARPFQLLPLELGAYQATGARVWRPHFLGLLAEGMAEAGRLDEALATIDEGLTLATRDLGTLFHRGVVSPQGELLLRSAADMASRRPRLLWQRTALRRRSRSLEIRRHARGSCRIVTSLAGLYARPGWQTKAARMLVR